MAIRELFRMSGRVAAVVIASSVGSFYLGSKFACRDHVLVETREPAAPATFLPAPQLEGDAARAGTVKATLAEGGVNMVAGRSRSAEIMQHGYPGFDNLRTYEDFILSYDRRTRTAHWVMEHLTPDRMTYDPSVDRSKSKFRADESIHPYFRSTNQDYYQSGYDRGHLAPAADHRRSQQAIDQTFLLTNISPQVGKGFNRDKWNELEKHMRHLAKKCLNIWICSGPLYLPQQEADGNLYVKYKVIGPNRVAVPTHFFKVALIEKERGRFELEAYMLPNEFIPDSKPLNDFLVPLPTIERAAGITLFDGLPSNMLNKVNGQEMRVGSGKLFGLL